MLSPFPSWTRAAPISGENRGWLVMAATPARRASALGSCVCWSRRRGMGSGVAASDEPGEIAYNLGEEPSRKARAIRTVCVGPLCRDDDLRDLQADVGEVNKQSLRPMRE